MARAAALFARMTAILDDQLGEVVEVQPLQQTDYDSVVDPERPSFQLRGQLTTTASQSLNIAGDRDGGDYQMRFGNVPTMFRFDPATFPDGTTAKAGDLLTVVEGHRTGIPYQITEIDSAQRVRWCWTLAEVAS